MGSVAGDTSRTGGAVVRMLYIQTMTSGVMLLCCSVAMAQQAGGIRGMVYDKDFEAPLAGVQVTIAEIGTQVVATDQGNYVFGEVSAGNYTLVFSKEGYTRQVRAGVVVQAGQITEIDAHLGGEFTEMDEFVVQDLQIGGETEAGLLALRADAPALIDSISAEFMSLAGASDAAAALNLVTGATVQEGKFAVIRGLPDRFVNSQMNGVRLPSADEDTRAVELDQFPSTVIESIQVTKTFTPDQQGDSSGGAVNVVLKGVPDIMVLQFSSGYEYNTQVSGRDDFLTYKGGGLDTFGRDGVRKQPRNGDFDGAVGVSRGDAPVNYDMDLTLGVAHEFEEGVRIGGFVSLFYERDSSFFDDGVNDSRWVENPGAPMTPQTVQGTPEQGEFKTQLFDVTRGTEEEKWGGLSAIGIETPEHSFKVLYMQTNVAEDAATLAEDTRGKQFYFPGHDPDDPSTPGHDQLFAAPFLRNETLEYTERTTDTLQISGRHTLPLPEFGIEGTFKFLAPEIDWTVAHSSAEKFSQKRQFGSLWTPGRIIDFGGGFPPFIIPATHLPFKPAENFTLGNVQFIFKDITEESDQHFVNLTFPFEQWTGDRGYIRFGLFNDEVTRKFNQDTYSNFNNNNVSFEGPFEEYFSAAFPTLATAGPITDGPPFVDVDYKGKSEISAEYVMVDVPLTSFLNIIGGVRFESTHISIVNDPEENATWLPPGASGPVALNPGDADVAFDQDDVLPSFGFVLEPVEKVTVRGTFAQTVARQTFKELSPIQQQEFLGGDVFIGNPQLKMAAVDNYDIRVDYTPFTGSLFSISYFYKDISDPIEYVQRNAGFTYTTPVNFPEGRLSGFEVEARQHLGDLWEDLTGLSIGANATFIDSEVTLSDEESAGFDQPNIDAPTSTRDMTNAPEYLYNLFLTYEVESTGTQLAVFYTVKGDTLITGAGQSNGNYVPDVYATEYGTLNVSVTQKLGGHFKLKIQAKNLTDPEIKEVYRSRYIGSDVTKRSHRNGVDLSVSLSAEFPF